MTVNGIILLTIVSSLVACGYADPKVLNDEFTLDQFAGRWFHMGEVTSCNNITVHPCLTLSVIPFEHENQNMFFEELMHENIPKCDRGVPIETGFVRGNLIGASISFDESETFSAVNSTIKSYNNGKELILAETGSEPCSRTSLWSRQREVSAETRTEFEKLTGNGTVEYTHIYNSWDNCPKVRGEFDEHSVVKLEGLWYDIAKIHYGDNGNDTCTLTTVTVDNETNTVEAVINSMNKGQLTVEIRKGNWTESGTVITIEREDAENHDEFYTVSCNNGQDLILVVEGIPEYTIASRNHAVTAEIMTVFEKIANMKKKSSESVYTRFSQDGCPERND